MAEQPLLKINGTCNGTGRVYVHETLIAEVTYRLFDGEQLEGSVPATIRPFTSPQTIFGTLESSSADELAERIGICLTLQLEDGNQINVTVVRHLKEKLCLINALSPVL